MGRLSRCRGGFEQPLIMVEGGGAGLGDKDWLGKTEVEGVGRGTDWFEEGGGYEATCSKFSRIV